MEGRGENGNRDGGFFVAGCEVGRGAGYPGFCPIPGSGCLVWQEEDRRVAGIFLRSDVLWYR